MQIEGNHGVSVNNNERDRRYLDVAREYLERVRDTDHEEFEELSSRWSGVKAEIQSVVPRFRGSS